LTKEEAKGLMKELCDPADDDGFMPFKRKLISHYAKPLCWCSVNTGLLKIKLKVFGSLEDIAPDN
jgi:hypothetical protein